MNISQHLTKYEMDPLTIEQGWLSSILVDNIMLILVSFSWPQLEWSGQIEAANFIIIPVTIIDVKRKGTTKKKKQNNTITLKTRVSLKYEFQILTVREFSVSETLK